MRVRERRVCCSYSHYLLVSLLSFYSFITVISISIMKKKKSKEDDGKNHHHNHPQQQQQQAAVWKGFASGSLGAMASGAVTHPIDLVKVRMQLYGECASSALGSSSSSSSSSSCLLYTSDAADE